MAPLKPTPSLDLPAALRFVRAHAALSQTGLAAAAGLSPAYVRKLEAGRAEPSLRVIRDLARGAGVPVPFLVGLACGAVIDFDHAGTPVSVSLLPRRTSP